jgi:hypothetical protein
MVGFFAFIGCMWFFTWLAREHPAAIIVLWIALLSTLAGFILFPVLIWYIILLVLAIVLMTVFITALPYLLGVVIGLLFLYFGIISLGTFVGHIAGK